jgi:sulfite exporter TauE/SafE
MVGDNQYMIWTAFIIGFAGSLHCLGMCSPLAMAVTNMSPAIVLNRLLYNFGRILTYGLMARLNGVLPCELSFLALTYCLTLAGPADGFIFMIRIWHWHPSGHDWINGHFLLVTK